MMKKLCFGWLTIVLVAVLTSTAEAGKCKEKEFTLSFVQGWMIEVDFWEGEIDLENHKTGKELTLFKEPSPPKGCLNQKPPKIVVKDHELTINLWKGVRFLRRLEIDYNELEIDLEEIGQKEKTLFKATVRK